MFYFDPLYMTITILFVVVSMVVSNRLKSKFKKYSKRGLMNDMSGREIAEKMLADHGILDVKVICTSGFLSDHYDPVKKTINLSEGVYNQRNVSSAAVAAHECGHAVQHAKGYEWLQLRSKMVPAVSVGANISPFLIILGIATASTFQFGYTVAIIGLILYSLATLFSFVTLPVEYDASNRALHWLRSKNIVNPRELTEASDALKWAARTYVVAAIGSLATLVYFAFRIMGSRD